VPPSSEMEREIAEEARKLEAVQADLDVRLAASRVELERWRACREQAKGGDRGIMPMRQRWKPAEDPRHGRGVQGGGDAEGPEDDLPGRPAVRGGLRRRARRERGGRCRPRDAGADHRPRGEEIRAFEAATGIDVIIDTPRGGHPVRFPPGSPGRSRGSP